MTSEYNAPNIDLQVREIIAITTSRRIDEIPATDTIEHLMDDDSRIYFWREIERQFDIAVTRAQRASLPTVGSVVHYLKLRAKVEAHGTL